MSPLTWLWGPIASFNVATIVGDVVVSPDEQWRWSGLLAEAGLHWIHVGGVYLYRVPYVGEKVAR